MASHGNCNTADLITDGALTLCCSQTCIPNIFLTHSLLRILYCPALTHILTMATHDVNNTCPSLRKKQETTRTKQRGGMREAFSDFLSQATCFHWKNCNCSWTHVGGLCVCVCVFVRLCLCLQVHNRGGGNDGTG